MVAGTLVLIGAGVLALFIEALAGLRFPIDPLELQPQRAEQHAGVDHLSTDQKLEYISAKASVVQAWLNLLALGGLVGTVLYARAAWLAAHRSAETAERALSGLERPWMVLDGAGITRKSPMPLPNDWNVAIRWKNIGRAPAEIISCEVALEDIEALGKAPDYTKATRMIPPRFLGPNGEFPLQAFGPVATVKGEPGTEPKPIQYVIYGRLIYRELGGESHETGFSFGISAFLPAISAYGAEGYDYYT